MADNLAGKNVRFHQGPDYRHEVEYVKSRASRSTRKQRVMGGFKLASSLRSADK